MLVTNYQPMLCNIPKQQRSHLQCGKSLKSRNHVYLQVFNMKSTGYPADASPMSIPPISDEVYVSACLLYCLCNVMLQLMEGWFSVLVESRDQNLKLSDLENGGGPWNYSKVQPICQETVLREAQTSVWKHGGCKITVPITVIL
jgi:hypothetical protein